MSKTASFLVLSFWRAFDCVPWAGGTLIKTIPLSRNWRLNYPAGQRMERKNAEQGKISSKVRIKPESTLCGNKTGDRIALKSPKGAAYDAHKRADNATKVADQNSDIGIPIP